MGELIQAWHVIAGILLGLPLVYARWVKPTLDWRKEVEQQLKDLHHHDEIFKVKVQAQVDSVKESLNRGNERFDKLEGKLEEIHQELQKVNLVLAQSVFRGVAASD